MYRTRPSSTLAAGVMRLLELGWNPHVRFVEGKVASHVLKGLKALKAAVAAAKVDGGTRGPRVTRPGNQREVSSRKN